MIQHPPPPFLPLSWPWPININVTPFANGTFQPTQAGDATSVSAALHMGQHTMRQTSSISLLFTTFISECSHLFVSEILKNVNSLRGDLPHAPGNVSSISTPGVGQPIPLRRFLPPSWPASQRRGHLDSHLRDSPSAIAISPNTRWTLWQCYRLFLYLSLSLAYGIQSSFCQR